MKKKWIYACGGSLLCLIAIWITVSICYHKAEAYFEDKFAPNTWINNAYCTGDTPQQINEWLVGLLEIPVITVTDKDGATYSYDLADADFQYDYSEVLTRYQKTQASNGFLYMMTQKSILATGDPQFTYDEEKVRDWWESLPIVKAESVKPVLEMKLGQEGYEIESTLDDHLDVNKGLASIVDAIAGKQGNISLIDAECYFDYEMDEAQKDTYDTYLELKELEKCGLVYDMGDEKIVFDGTIMNGFIAKDENGNPFKNEDGKYYYDLTLADQFMKELCESYHTYGVERKFKSSRENGEIVTVKPGNFGTEIDTKKEVAYLREVLSDPVRRLEKTVHVPTYLHETSHHGLDDTGGTYIEVDKTRQMIFFYKDHQLMVSSGVVTGNLRSRHDTYEGAFQILGKYKNRVLRGPGYASFVRRWMPIYKAIGLHDANWRKESEFGGETYKRNGSHGCVNMPDETTDVIFEHAEVGTPVFIFSTPEE